MSRRWAWWAAGGLLLVVLLSLGAWRFSREIPERLRRAEEDIRKAAAEYGLQASYRNLRFHFLYPRLSLDALDVRDAATARRILFAESVEVAISPARLLSGETPVSRIRIRNFTLDIDESNRPLIDRIRSAEGKGSMPEFLLLDGNVRIGPFGPVKRWAAKIPELRVREVRFLGTRITLKAEEAAGEVILPAAGAGSWPFAALDADLVHHDGAVRVRRLRGKGPSASLKLSGLLEPARRAGDVKLSGEFDLAGWISSGAPGSGWLGRMADRGSLEFSATLKGTLDDPRGTGKFLLRNGRLRGDTAAEGDADVTADRRRIQIGSLKGKLLGGHLSGSGYWEMDSGRMEGKLSLRRMAFGAAPWKELGFAWRPAGSGDAEIEISGDVRRIHGAVAVRNPSGLERIAGTKGAGGAIRLPVSASATGDYLPGDRLAISGFRLRAGEAEASGKGDLVFDGTRLKMEGDFSVPGGKSAEYGLDSLPLSWKGITGRWEIDGPAAGPHVAVRVDGREISAWSLPAVPLAVRLDGNPADAVHFVADIPARVAKTTAIGTFTGPMSGRPFLVDATLAAREIDFSEAARWVTAAISASGKDPGTAARHLSGLAGEGSADLQMSLGREIHSVSGTFRSGDLRLGGIRFGNVSAEGNWNRSGGGDAWKARGKASPAEGGEVRVAGEGRNGSATVSGEVDRLDLGKALPVLAPGIRARIGGIAGLSFSARTAGGPWEIVSLSASVPGLSIDNVALANVTAEGSLGSSSGRIVVASRSPAARLTAEVARGGDWQAGFTLSAGDVPTGFLLSAAGRPDPAAKGKWSVTAEGKLPGAALLGGGPFRPDAVASLRFSAVAASPSVSGLDFGELRAEGRREGDAVIGEIRSAAPDSRLAFSLSLREPYRFGVEGPLSMGSANGKGKEEGKAKFSLDGRVEISGALSALEGTAGTFQVRRFSYRSGGFEVSGKDVLARLRSDGIHWEGGTLVAAGNPVLVSGKASWKGDLDARVEGSVPASAIHLVTDVFDRLDGSMRLDLRLTGKWNDPVLVGTGRLDGGIFSFRGYAQLFEEMRADAIISREKIIFEHFEGRSGGGYLDGRGELPLRFDAHQRLFFTVDFFDMRYPYPDDFRPVVQGHVELLGPYDDFLVTGEVEIQAARFTRSLRPEKALLDFRKRLVDVTARKEKTDFRVRLDINVNADGTIRIKNNIADATAKGEFKVLGDANRVILLGAFDVIEGYVEYRGNRYELKRVGVEFQDPRRNNPRLDVRAETKKGNVTVIVSVTGTLDKYEVDLTSDPPLGKNDIVALLSLGVTTQALVGSEGTVSAAAASSIVLGPYKGQVEEGIRGIVSLDKFAIEPSFSTSTKAFEPKFIVGKSFGDQVSVSVSTSVGSTPESSAVAEYKIMENVFLQGAWESAAKSREGDVGADIKVRYRYRQLKDLLRGRD